MESTPLWFARLAVLGFFAVAFVQSAADKWLDSRGNLEFLQEHFGKTPLRATVVPMFWTITVMESAAGVLCGLGALQVLVGGGAGIGFSGLGLATLSLLALFFGQRVAKDYAGAAVLASYFAVALIGLALLGLRVP